MESTLTTSAGNDNENFQMKVLIIKQDKRGDMRKSTWLCSFSRRKKYDKLTFKKYSYKKFSQPLLLLNITWHYANKTLETDLKTKQGNRGDMRKSTWHGSFSRRKKHDKLTFKNILIKNLCKICFHWITLDITPIKHLKPT